MKNIYQVINNNGYVASREGNEQAIFLDKEEAEKHIDFLKNDCGLDDMEFKIIDLFNFDSWQETHFEIVSAIKNTVDINGTVANEIMKSTGTGGMYDLARELTNKFENQYKNIEWGEELIYQDTIEEFVNKEL